MKIQKIFSDEAGEERLYSVLISEEELKLFTKWDETDQFKQMKDSDILAEKKRSNTGSYMKAAKIGLAGAAIGGTLLGAKKGFAGQGLAGMASGLKTGAKIGAVAGTIGGLAATHGERSENRFVNDRLERAQYQALRREKKDWRNNTTNREGYTY